MRGALRGALVAVVLRAGGILLAPAALLDDALAQRTQDRCLSWFSGSDPAAH